MFMRSPGQMMIDSNLEPPANELTNGSGFNIRTSV